MNEIESKKLLSDSYEEKEAKNQSPKKFLKKFCEEKGYNYKNVKVSVHYRTKMLQEALK